MSEYNKSKLEFHKKIHNKKILANYKTSAEQWKKLYEEEHRKVLKLQEKIDKLEIEIRGITEDD